jgi:apolipoprotein N-acyltransferase
MLRKIGKSLLLCVLSALLLALPYWDGRLWIFAWFAFVPVFFALNNKSLKQSFVLFYITGVIFWSCAIYWLVHVTLGGTIALILYLALYFAAFGLIIRPFTKHPTLFTFIFIPSAWILLEYLRSFLLTGFPWALLGYSQYLNLPVIQIVDLTGALGVSFLVMAVNVALVEMIWSAREGLRARFKAAVLFAALLLFAALAYGYGRLYRPARSVHFAPLTVSVIQGNIAQEMKWDASARDLIVDRYIRLTREAAKDSPDLIIWPEASLPVIADEEQPYYETVKGLAREINTPILLGAVTRRQKRFYNGALLISRDGLALAEYDKVHLVPFGEYIPLKKIFPFLETIVPIGEISPGEDLIVFQPLRFSVLICFEDLFPELSRRCVKKGARFLVNITNDAWYKRTPAAYQHLAASVFRAVENRVFLVRAANTGVSAFINPQGKIISSVRDGGGNEIFVTGKATLKIGD